MASRSRRLPGIAFSRIHPTPQSGQDMADDLDARPELRTGSKSSLEKESDCSQKDKVRA